MFVFFCLLANSTSVQCSPVQNWPVRQLEEDTGTKSEAFVYFLQLFPATSGRPGTLVMAWTIATLLTPELLVGYQNMMIAMIGIIQSQG